MSPLKESTAIPTRSFLLLVLAITGPVALMAARDSFLLAKKLGIDALHSKTWLALLAGLTLMGAFSLIALPITFFLPRREVPHSFLLRVSSALEKFDARARKMPLLGWLILLVGLLIYPFCLLHPYYGELLAKQPWLRGFIFWMTVLLAGQGFRWAAGPKSQAESILIVLILQSALTQFALYLPDISTYPFAMGWSETSRFYYPALFLSQKIFGANFSWPILHPSLHLLLTPPYFINAPLWFHRLWQVALRLLMLGLIAPALISRLKIESRSVRWLTALWIWVYLLTLPLYLHLAVPVVIMLLGFSSKEKNEPRVWFWLTIASIWAGLSRLNWYPIPGILAATLYALEIPIEKKGWRYFLKPGLWFFYGTGLAFITMQLYIRLSGIGSQSDFYTSLRSNLLWDRMLPNESYWLGVLPGIVIFSLPLWLSWAARARKLPFGALRAGMLLGALLVLFVGGLLVSMKIGGGADIHNMDAYAVLLLIIFAYIFFDQVIPERIQPAPTGGNPSIRIASLILLVLIPAWFAVQGSGSLWQYDTSKSQSTLAALQQKVDAVNASGGQVLFITQRHLISMHMLKNVTLTQEYEREELMEMAMAQNDAYLQVFRADLEAHRFAAIIVDPLRFNFIGEQDAMGAENNAWTRYVVKRILCNYREEAVFTADRIAIYVPQTGEQKCP